jgi:glycosyltransferase involved in cell wall biosynthesis
VSNIYISAIVCTHNRSELLSRSIECLINQTFDKSRYEIIVVDNASTDNTRQVCDRFIEYSNFNYLYEPVTGLSIARNTGIAHAKGEIVAFIDDDAFASPGLLEAYTNAFTSINPPPAMVGGKLLPEWEVPCPSWYPEERKFILGLYDIGDQMREFPHTHLPAGANFAAVRKVIEDLGGFDRGLGFDEGRKNPLIAGEDSLMAQKIKKADYKIYYCPEAMVHHNIADYKLTKKYFLRRHYWEGRTVINVLGLKSHLSISRLFAMIAWHSMLALKELMALLLTFFRISQDAESRRMLSLGLIFLRFGTLNQLLNFFFLNTGSSKGITSCI